MDLTTRVRGVLDWLRAGYPSGVPPTDYLPLLALLRRRLTEEEVAAVATGIAHESTPAGQPVDPVEIGVRITSITDALPSAEDVSRVEEQLTREHGWPSELD